MSFNPGFKYEPLFSSTSMRVLLINPGAVNDEIHCNFFPCDLNADHEKFPNCPRPVESMSIGTNKATGRTFFITLDIILDDGPGATGQQLHPFQRYKALSYVWGDTTDLQTIKRDFCSTSHAIWSLGCWVLRTTPNGSMTWWIT